MGLEVLLINFRENPDVVRRTVRERGYVAPVPLDQSGDVTGKVYGVWAPPTMYFVDRRGRLIGQRTRGLDLVAIIRTLLHGPQYVRQRLEFQGLKRADSALSR